MMRYQLSMNKNLGNSNDDNVIAINEQEAKLNVHTINAYPKVLDAKIVNK